MLRLLSILLLVPIAAWSTENRGFTTMLSTAVTNQGPAYLLARNAIVEHGTNALPILGQLAVENDLSWQQRLIARICYERILRGAEIEGLRHCDWRKQPGYDARWESSMAGPGLRMTEIALRHLESKGLFYYYIELTWKPSTERADTQLKDLNTYMPWWCRKVLESHPEQVYLQRAMEERLESDILFAAPDANVLYKELLKNKIADAVPVLVNRYNAFNKREVSGPEIFAGRHAELYRGMFEPILSFADSRHAELLEKFFGEHPALAELKPKMANVRARPAPEPKTDPPFRLGTNVVSVAQ